MYSAEVLSQLRTLNWMAQELRRLPSGSSEAGLMGKQIEAVRSRLPTSILNYHDSLAAKGRVSAAQVRGVGCGACHLKLPVGLVAELGTPGRFGVCPNCGVFLWKGEARLESPRIAAKPAARKVFHG